jgi:flagellar hook-associated protein 3 FlgL
MTNSITGIPTTRVTEAFTRNQILRQSQFNQLALSRLEAQLSSGYRFQTPSEDPIAAMQAIGLQRLLQRKEQVNSNLDTTQSYLRATDTALGSLSDLLVQARVTALSVVGTTTTETQRMTAAQQIDQAIQQMFNTGNQQFRGRYLFSGSESLSAPFATNAAGFIEYLGNDKHLMSYSDLNLLTSTNVTGNEAFGAISAEVRGTATVIPTVTYDTRLADLRQGQGISQGSIAVSDGKKNPDGSLNEVVIDLSGAKSIGDIAALIKSNPPLGRQLYVDVTKDKLTIRLDAALGGNLTIREVGSGTVAEELGIRNQTGTGTNPIVGRPLEPVLRSTTSLDNLFGSYATTVVHSRGTDNDIRLKADVMGSKTSAGLDLNGINVVLQPDFSVVAGSEFVDPIAGGTLTVHVAGNGLSRAYQVVAAINAAHQAGTIPFAADIDPLDNVGGGLGFVDLGAAGLTAGGGGEPFDDSHGLRIVNNGLEQTIDFTPAKTLGDVINILNGSGTGVRAEINAAQNGIDLFSKVSGCNFAVGENGGKTAAQFGIRSLNDSTSLAELNHGSGVNVSENSTAVYAEAVLRSAANNANWTIRAKKSAGDPGANYWNGFIVSTVDTGDDPPTVVYDSAARTLTIGVKTGTTTANDVIRAVNTGAASGDFEAVVANNADGSVSNGTGPIVPGTAVTNGGTPVGNDFTITRADGVTLYIDVSAARTIDDVIAAINNESHNVALPPTPGNPNPGKLQARLAIYGNGIELVDQSGGQGDVVVVQNKYSHAAVDLGLVPKDQTTSNSGIPDHAATLIPTTPQSGILIHGRDPSAPINGVKVVLDGTASGVIYNENTRTLTVGFTAGATTAQQVVDAINNSPAAALFEAELAPIPNAGTGAIADGGPFVMSGGSAANKSQANAVMPGFDNDLIFAAKNPGITYNNVQVQFTGIPGGPGGVAGAVNFSRAGNTITVNYDSTLGADANQIVAAWGNAANWPVDDPARTELAVSLDPADGVPNLGGGLAADASATIAPVASGVKIISGADVNPQETLGIFTALMRMRDAIRSNNLPDLERSVDMLDKATTKLNYTRAELGSRQQGLKLVQDSLASENIDLQSAHSQNRDVDMVEVVSDLTARQTAYQASLMSLGKILQISLLNYL